MEKLYHISEEPRIKIFHPRPSPQKYGSIKGSVVFAISDKMLHNYLVPRDCPRVTYYIGPQTSESDKKKFFGESTCKYIINVEKAWAERINNIKLYEYAFDPSNFVLLDETAGYYISDKPETPLSITGIKNVRSELDKRSVELRFLQEIAGLAKDIANSTLNFSIIRMRNSIKNSEDIQTI